MRSDDGGVDHRVFVVRIVRQRLEKILPNAAFCPAREPRMNVLPMAEALGQIAPVTAVRGNVDTEPWALSLPETEVVEADGVSIYVLHDLGQLNLKPQAAGFRVVVYGHSHQPKIEEKDGVLYFNPGSAGPRRFKLPVSVGRLVIEAGKVRAELVELKI